MSDIDSYLHKLAKIDSDNILITDAIQDSLSILEKIHEGMKEELEDLSKELSEAEERLEELEEEIAGLNKTIEEFEEAEIEKTLPYDQLKQACLRYNTGIKSEQENILKILRDEFDLDLICL
jgi:chromosome segregation ATPase